MSSSIYSTLGLVCCSIPVLLHGPELVLPMTGGRLVVNYVLSLFGGEFPHDEITADDQVPAIDAMIQHFDAAKWSNAANYAFLLIFEQKQGSAGFLATAIGAAYTATLPLAQRHPVHFMFIVLSSGMAVANASHTGLSFLGEHPFISPAGRNVGYAFTPFWAASTYFNYMAFTVSKAALTSKND